MKEKINLKAVNIHLKKEPLIAVTVFTIELLPHNRTVYRLCGRYNNTNSGSGREARRFVTDTDSRMELGSREETLTVMVECENRELVTLYNGEMVDNDSWLLKMSQEEVESLIAASQSEDLCGRRPWTNVINHQELYPRGNSQGFSGLPYGSDPLPEGVR